MKDNWLWDRKITYAAARRILKKPAHREFLTLAALLLSRENEPGKVLKKYIDPVTFCRYWAAIKKRMRQDKWSEPRIIFWQAIYEKLAEKYRRRGIVFRREAPAGISLCIDIGKKIKDIRRGQGLPQKGLAGRAGVSQQLISRIEKGRENVSMATLINIANALDRKIEINFLAKS